jgi:hypothetical protein
MIQFMLNQPRVFSGKRPRVHNEAPNPSVFYIHTVGSRYAAFIVVRGKAEAGFRKVFFFPIEPFDLGID